MPFFSLNTHVWDVQEPQVARAVRLHSTFTELQKVCILAESSTGHCRSGIMKGLHTLLAVTLMLLIKAPLGTGQQKCKNFNI